MSSSNSNKNKKTLLDFSNLTKKQKKLFENMVNNKSDSFDSIDFESFKNLESYSKNTFNKLPMKFNEDNNSLHSNLQNNKTFHVVTVIIFICLTILIIIYFLKEEVINFYNNIVEYLKIKFNVNIDKLKTKKEKKEEKEEKRKKNLKKQPGIKELERVINKREIKNSIEQKPVKNKQIKKIMQNPVNKGIKKIMSKVKIPPGDKKYCYIGEFKGVRSCVEVKNSDTCMSGDIFPTHDVCINPSLRV